MRVGLYFGSFNPIHFGHLIIANHILNETRLQKVWFVVSPQNPFKQSATLLNEYNRFFLVQKAIEDDLRLRAIDIEFALPKPSYTIHTLSYLQEKYPNHLFTIIMGSDSFQNLPKWKNADVIIKNYPLMVYRRPGFEIETIAHASMEILNAPFLQISATYIRNLIASGKSIRHLVPPLVEKEIIENGYYRKLYKK